MATYKKRGSKPKSKDIEEKSTTAGVFNTLDESASKTEAWVAKNQNLIFGIVGGIAVIVLGFFAYQKFIKAPKEAEAASEMAQAQVYFSDALETTDATIQDSLYVMSLNGNGGMIGFTGVIEDYSGTDAANLAHYYAGMAYLKTGDYKNAISHLDQFESEDELLAPLAVGGIGDAFMQLEQAEQALNYYEKAANMRENSFTTPKFLLKAAITAIELGQAEKAEQHLTKLKENYPDSPEADKTAVYLGIARAME
jgi:tetratricopeptide (TPR) repeat protein